MFSLFQKGFPRQKIEWQGSMAEVVGKGETKERQSLRSKDQCGCSIDGTFLAEQKVSARESCIAGSGKKCL